MSRRRKGPRGFEGIVEWILGPVRPKSPPPVPVSYVARGSIARIPWAGRRLTPGDDLILDTSTGELKARRWGVRPIRKVHMAKVVGYGYVEGEAGSAYADIVLPFTYGRCECAAS